MNRMVLTGVGSGKQPTPSPNIYLILLSEQKEAPSFLSMCQTWFLNGCEILFEQRPVMGILGHVSKQKQNKKNPNRSAPYH